MRPLLLLLALTALTACRSSDTEDEAADAEAVVEDTRRDVERELSDIDIDIDDVNLSSRPAGTRIQAVTTRNGELELGVTDSVLYSRLSPELQLRIESEMEDETADETGLGGAIARAVTGAVSKGLQMAVSVPLDQVRDVRYEDGRVVIEMEDGDASPFETSKTDDEPMLEQFDAEAGRQLADAFAKAKRG